MTRPTIGVTLSRSTGWWAFPLFAQAIARAGGRAVKWSSAASVDIDGVDGIVVGGGDRIGLALSDGGLRLAATADRARDVLDRWALEAAFADGKPVLAVGFGAMRLNAALGGTTLEWKGSPARHRAPTRTFRTRQVRPLPGSALAAVSGKDPFPARAFRRQTIGRLGLGLHVAARDEDNLIQAIERARAPFAIGVQWHPERTPLDPRGAGVFRALVAAARDLRQDRAPAGPCRGTHQTPA